jgi:fatty acid desaturase
MPDGMDEQLTRQDASAAATGAMGQAALPSDPIHACLGIDRAALLALTADLHGHKAWIYWVDLSASLATGYGAFALLPLRQPLSLTTGILYAVAVLATYRAMVFTHEIAHMPPRRLPRFQHFWNLACGIPLLIPSYFYDDHMAHHAKRTYGTSDDGEYLPYARLPASRLALLFAASPLALPAMLLRFLLLTPTMLFWPSARRLVLTRASSLVIDPDHRRPSPAGGWKWSWTMQEAGCFAWCLAVVLAVAFGKIAPARLAAAAALLSGVFAVNALRTVLAHRYAGLRTVMAFQDQVLDSNDFPHPMAMLWAPVGLRFHAVHHLLPSLPYHALPILHRRLMAALPADSPYRDCQHASLFAGIRSFMRLRRSMALSADAATRMPSAA